MSAPTSVAILVDTGFWYGYLDPKDQHHKAARSRASYLQGFQLIIPWPILYETIGTRLVRRRDQIFAFEKILKQKNITYLDDENYRSDALDLSLESGKEGKRPLSLVDTIIRLILDDQNIRIKGLLTFNEKDFRDVCKRNRVDILTL